MSEKINFYKNLQPFLDCKDYTVSGENYQIKKNSEFDMLVTTPVPKNLSNYYKSEDYISHTDSRKSLFDKIYQFVKKISLNKKLQLINSFYSPSKNILDIGAGTGDFLNFCQLNSWNVFGVEPSEKARNIASKKGIELKENINLFQNKKFDVITLWHVLEHVENLSEYIHLLSNLLSDNGRLVIAVPNYKSYDAHYYKEFWAAFDVPRHLWHFSQSSIDKLFSLVDMSIEEIKPMKFDSYYVALLSEKYKNKKMNPFKSFFNGFYSNLKATQTNEYSSLIYVLKKN